MNIIITRILCLVTLISISGCSTVEVKKVKKLDKAAVATVTADAGVDYTDFGEQGKGYIGSFNHIDLDTMALRIKKKVYKKLPSVLPIKLMDEDKVINSERYQNFTMYDDEDREERYRDGQKVETLENYKPYNLATSRIMKFKEKMVDAVPKDADALVFSGVEYKVNQEQDYGGSGDASVTAKIHLVMINNNKEKLIDIAEKGTTEKTFRLESGAAMPDEDHVEGLMVVANNKAFKSLTKTLQEEF
jgi:hypothetical protein